MSSISIDWRIMARRHSQLRRLTALALALFLSVALLSVQGCTLYARWLHVKGTKLDLTGDFAAAAEYYRSAIEEDPELAEPRLELANYYYWQGQYRAAEREYMAVLEREPENQRAKRALTQCRLHVIEEWSR